MNRRLRKNSTFFNRVNLLMWNFKMLSFYLGGYIWTRTYQKFNTYQQQEQKYIKSQILTFAIWQ